MTKIEKIAIISGRELIKRERKRLTQLILSNKEWWDGQNSNWAREQFGNTLTEKDGSIYSGEEPFNEHMCQVCGNIPDLDVKVLQLVFSFCDEYGCSMNICRKCCDDLGERLDE
jgi:hypothetical protein